VGNLCVDSRAWATSLCDMYPWTTMLAPECVRFHSAAAVGPLEPSRRRTRRSSSSQRPRIFAGSPLTWSGAVLRESSLVRPARRHREPLLRFVPRDSQRPSSVKTIDLSRLLLQLHSQLINLPLLHFFFFFLLLRGGGGRPAGESSRTGASPPPRGAATAATGRGERRGCGCNGHGH
jgi:hypothetical protein